MTPPTFRPVHWTSVLSLYVSSLLWNGWPLVSSSPYPFLPRPLSPCSFSLLSLPSRATPHTDTPDSLLPSSRLLSSQEHQSGALGRQKNTASQSSFKATSETAANASWHRSVSVPQHARMEPVKPLIFHNKELDGGQGPYQFRTSMLSLRKTPRVPFKVQSFSKISKVPDSSLLP